MKAVSNPQGRLIYLFLIAVCFVLLCCSVGACIWYPSGEHIWLPILATLFTSMAFTLMLALLFFEWLYLLRWINVGFFSMIALGILMTVILAFRMIEVDFPLFMVIVDSLCTGFFIALALILAPHPYSDLAHQLHPWIGHPDLDSISMTPVNKTGSKHQNEAQNNKISGGKRRIKHREVNIFENWPAPLPFASQALYTYRTTNESELSFTKGDKLVIIDCRGNWWNARHPDNDRTGFVPSNYIQVLQKAIVKEDFNGKDQDEVSVQSGQTIEVMETHQIMSLVRTVDGKIGSVPTRTLVLQ